MTDEFADWLAEGIARGWCSDQFCETHDGGPISDREQDAWAEGEDFCRHMVRLGSPTDWDNDLGGSK